MASVTYGKSIMSSVIMAKILWQMKLSQGSPSVAIKKGREQHAFQV